MAIKVFELFHGAVLTKVLRSEKPVSLRLVETRPKENWSTYTLNDTVDLLISYSRQPRPLSRQGGTSWTFVFSENQLRQLDPSRRGRPVWAALVCGRKSIDRGDMHICLLDPDQLPQLLDFCGPPQSLTVRAPGDRRSLRVFKDRRERFVVPQSRIDRWEIPGR
ncbi:MAG: hypothetical protein D6725_04040 [Planctomycetota bacterium]|nr:MAG: hypothetical protein D6725_04040 [Planctomycetota bacterium]